MLAHARPFGTRLASLALLLFITDNFGDTDNQSNRQKGVRTDIYYSGHYHFCTEWTSKRLTCAFIIIVYILRIFYGGNISNYYAVLGTSNPALVRQNAYDNYNESIQSLRRSRLAKEHEVVQQQQHLEIPFQSLVRSQAFGLPEHGSDYKVVIRKCFNELDLQDAQDSALILVPLFEASPPSFMSQELSRMGHVVIKTNKSTVLMAFLKALHRSLDDVKMKDSLPNVLDKCWLLNQKQMSTLFLR